MCDNPYHKAGRPAPRKGRKFTTCPSCDGMGCEAPWGWCQNCGHLDGVIEVDEEFEPTEEWYRRMKGARQ